MIHKAWVRHACVNADLSNLGPEAGDGKSEVMKQRKGKEVGKEYLSGKGKAPQWTLGRIGGRVDFEPLRPMCGLMSVGFSLCVSLSLSHTHTCTHLRACARAHTHMHAHTLSRAASPGRPVAKHASERNVYTICLSMLVGALIKVTC